MMLDWFDVLKMSDVSEVCVLVSDGENYCYLVINIVIGFGYMIMNNCLLGIGDDLLRLWMVCWLVSCLSSCFWLMRLLMSYVIVLLLRVCDFCIGRIVCLFSGCIFCWLLVSVDLMVLYCVFCVCLWFDVVGEVCCFLSG